MKSTFLLLLGVTAACLIGAQPAGSQEPRKAAAEPSELADMQVHSPEKIAWRKGPESLPAGAQIAVLEGDPGSSGPFVFRVKVPDGYTIPPHTHPKAERVTVIAGTFHIAMTDKVDKSAGQAMPTGAFGYWPAGMKHFAWVTGETIVQFHGIGPWQINYLNPADDPRNAKKPWLGDHAYLCAVSSAERKDNEITTTPRYHRIAGEHRNDSARTSRVQGWNRTPDFSLPTVDGKTVGLTRSERALQLTRDSEVQKPTVLAVHLLQPDCLQCRAQLAALQALSEQFQNKGMAVLGVSHRGSMDDLKKLGEDLGIKFPLLNGVGSEWAKQFAAGDAFAIVDRSGKVQYVQVGFGNGDEALWTAAIEEVLTGKTVTKPAVERERLAVGDRFPAVELPALVSGKNIGLIGKNGRLVFKDEQGVEKERKGAVGFFSRYWAFSREEMVHLQKFHERYADKGLQVFVVAMHPDPVQAKKITGELKVTYPIFNGLESDLGKLYAFG